MAELIEFDNESGDLEEPPRYTDQSMCVRQPCKGTSDADHRDEYSLIASEATTGFNATYYQALAYDYEMGRTQGIDAALAAYDLDALVLPAPGFTTVPAGVSISEEVDATASAHLLKRGCTAIAGYPIVTGKFPK